MRSCLKVSRYFPQLENEPRILSCYCELIHFKNSAFMYASLISSEKIQVFVQQVVVTFLYYASMVSAKILTGINLLLFKKATE